MATSTITFYSTNITPDRNAVVDSIAAYLTDCPNEVIYGLQYQKISMHMTIKINKSQADFPKMTYNYAEINNSGNPDIFYFFIIGEPKWLSTSTIEYTLLMDTVNTFRNKVQINL